MSNLKSFLVTKKRLLKLIIVSVIFLTVGAILGLILSYQPVTEPQSPYAGEKTTPKIATYSGTIKPLGSSVSQGGTHFLEGAAGEVIAILKGVKIDLSFFEGQTVEVEGTIKGDVLEVEKIIL